MIVTKEDLELPKERISKELGGYHVVMVEDFVPGQELACGVLGNESLEVVEVRESKDNRKIRKGFQVQLDEGVQFFSAKAKDDVLYKLVCPAPNLPEKVVQQIKAFSLLAHKAIGCSGISRSDWKYDLDTGRLIWLELNTQPGNKSIVYLKYK